MHVGIDLGTSNSVIAGYADGQLRVFKTLEGNDVLPSAVYIDKRGHRMYGGRAYQQAARSPENVASGFKRLMGSSTELHFAAANVTLTPEECSAQILRQLVGQVCVEAGEIPIPGVMITIPAAFNQMQSEATLRAAKLAELEKVALLQEPIAAAMAAMVTSKTKNSQFLVYDLGGGTFDLALVQCMSGAVNIIAHEGINMLGGRDFDQAIVDTIVRPWLQERFALPSNYHTIPKYQKMLRIARLAAEKSKIALSNTMEEVIFAPDDEMQIVDEEGENVYVEVPLSRKDLDALIAPKIDETIILCRRILLDNGYSSSDIQRVVFIGGPSKTPLVRERVSKDLGIPADMQTDPMTAVALGAAIYCESREWGTSSTTRKASRGSMTSADHKIRFDYPARTADDRAKVLIRVEAIDATLEAQLDSQTGWTSGRRAVGKECLIEVPLDRTGDNQFQSFVFDGSGRPIQNSIITIIRTPASATGVPATQNISVKTLVDGTTSRNVLSPLIKKGTLLPADGSERFRAAKEVRAGSNEHLDLELYQDDGVPVPELNLVIGCFRIAGTDLPDGMAVRKGQEIIFKWAMDDSGILQATVELPELAQSFPVPKFYTSEAGHRTFEGEDGRRLAAAALSTAAEDLEESEATLNGIEDHALEELKARVETQRSKLDAAYDADTKRAIVEEARSIRQAVAKMTRAPSSRRVVLASQLEKLRDLFQQYVRDQANVTTTARFDLLVQKAELALRTATVTSLDDAERIIDEANALYYQQMWQNPGYLIYMFKKFRERRYLAIDKERFDGLISAGKAAIEANAIADVRRIIGELYENQLTVGSADKELSQLASIMKA